MQSMGSDLELCVVLALETPTFPMILVSILFSDEIFL